MKPVKPYCFLRKDVVAIGLDLSLNSTGVAVYYGSDNPINTFTIKGGNKIEDHMDKVIHVKREIMKLVKKVLKQNTKDFSLFIEGQAYCSKGRSVISIAQLHGVMMYVLKMKKVDFKIIPPTVVKKHVTGKGNAKKSLILKSLYKKYKIDLSDEDEADAVALVLTGLGV